MDASTRKDEDTGHTLLIGIDTRRLVEETSTKYIISHLVKRNPAEAVMASSSLSTLSMNPDAKVITWLLEVLHWMRVLSHGEKCQQQDVAEQWLRGKLQECPKS